VEDAGDQTRGGAARVHRSSIEIDAPGVKTTRAWAREAQCDMRDPPEAKAGLGDALGCAHDDGGGSVRRRIVGARVPATRASLGPRHLAQDDQEDDVVLTEGLNGSEKRCRLAGDEDRRRRQGGARGGTAAEMLRASGLLGSVRGTPVEVAKRLGRPEMHQWRGIALRRGTYRRRVNGGGAFQSKQQRTVQRLGARWGGCCDLG
jgi:hypothetical protein